MRHLKPAGISPGFTLIEVGIASVLMAALMAGALMFAADQLRLSSAQSEGTALAALNTAVNQYESQFANNLTAHTAVPIAGYGNVANPYSPTPTELLELGFLKTNVPSGIYGISINTTVTNGTPSGIVWIINPFKNNLGQASQDLAAAAMISAGGDAAISTIANPAVVEGIDGWTTTNPVANTAAILAMRNGAGSAAYVRLDGSTPMQGSLSFNNYNLSSVNTLGATTANLGSANISNLNTTNIVASGNISAGGNSSGATLTATAEGNDVFFGSSALYSDGWNTVIRNTGGALYVQDFSGNAKPVVASQLVTPGGNGVQVGSSVFYGDSTNSAIRQNGTLYIQNLSGGTNNVEANRVTADEYVQISGGASAGAGCGPNGLVGRDGSGSLLSCVNGAWAYPGGNVPAGTLCGSVTINGYNGTPNDPASTKISCQGLDIYSQGCPSGYYYAAVYAASALWHFSCIKS